MFCPFCEGIGSELRERVKSERSGAQAKRVRLWANSALKPTWGSLSCALPGHDGQRYHFDNRQGRLARQMKQGH